MGPSEISVSKFLGVIHHMTTPLAPLVPHALGVPVEESKGRGKKRRPCDGVGLG